MTQEPLRNYFALECGEFLDRMETLVEKGGSPDLEQLTRLARSIRGSARIAGAAAADRAAMTFEKALRGLAAEGRWEERHRQLAVRTVDDLRVLVRSHVAGESGEERSRAVVERWQEVADAADAGGAEPARSPVAGMVPFIRSELTALASMLAELRSAREGDGDANEVALRCVRRMRVVRGVKAEGRVGEVQEPLGEVEEFLSVILAPDSTLGDDADAVLALGSRLLEETAVALAEDRSPRALPLLSEFRERWPEAVGRSTDVISLAELFPDDGEPVLVSSRTAPVPPAGDGLPDEVVEFVRIETTGLLDQAQAALAGGADERGRRQVADLATAVAELAGTYRLDRLAGAARSVARSVRGGEEADLGDALRALREDVPGAPVPASAGAGAPSAEPPQPAAPQPEAATGAESEAGVVPVETLLYSGRAALAAALELRTEVERLVERETTSGSELRERLAELFDLIELGMNGDGGAAR